MTVFLAILIALCAGLAALAARLLERTRHLAAEAEADRRALDALEREAAGLRRAQAQLLADREFLPGFLREFPHLTRELHTGIKERQVPAVLLNVVARSLAPRQALVLVRRKSVESDPGRASRMVVAAVAPEDGPVAVGTELPIGVGELGYAAETQRVMSRRDFDSESAITRTRLKPGELPGFVPDLVAPMVSETETLGLIALVQPSWTDEDAKAALRLIAHMGALALRSAAAYTQMKTTAELDGLTGVLNKRSMTQILAERAFEASRQLQPLSIFLFDIDNFKNYNDANGHLEGDRLLRELARLVQERLRPDDAFGRFGGEEFLLMLPDTPLAAALAVADKIRRAIAEHPFRCADRQPLGVVSVSGGVAECPGDGLDSSRLVRAADEALYEAKREGRNRVLPAPRRYLSDDAHRSGLGEPGLGAGD